jgi:cytochrome o ubiquinol oxidase subunit 3
MTTHAHDHHVEAGDRAIFGFWTFLLSDFIMFAALFASYVVLQHNTYGGIGIKDIVGLPYVLITGFALLVSSFTYGLSSVAFDRTRKAQALFWLLITFLFGLAFVLFEGHLFSVLIDTGNTWHKSAFLSIYFTLLGIHWFHVIVALLWAVVVFFQLSAKGLTSVMRTRLTCLGMFFHFLNIIWIFIFAIVYLMGAV